MTVRPVLATPRLVLRPQTLTAARALLAGADCGLQLGAGYPHADSLDALRMHVEHGGPDDGGWFVTLRSDRDPGDSAGDPDQPGLVIGDCGTYGPPDEAGRVEIGYGLAAPSRGHGFGTEAVGALVDWLAARPDVRLIVASVEIGNHASGRLLEKVGFTRVAGDATDDRHWLFERGV